MSDFSQALIQYEGEKEDQLLSEAFPFLFKKDLPTLFNAEGIQEEDSSLMGQSFPQGQSDSVEQSNEMSNTNEESKGMRKPLKKLKMIKKSRTSFTDSSEQSYPRRARRSPKHKVNTNKPYPTKNFLPNFKTPHLQFLQTYLKLREEEFGRIPFVAYLREKDGISLEDYQQLYNMNDFAEAFEAMFKSKYLYRELVLSRSNMENKINHMKRLHVFEEAFRTKVFTKIN